jgi:thiazole/oxazole-forming peptide maturase SagD family component
MAAAELREAVDRFVDDRFGIITALRTAMLQPPQPAWWLTSCVLSRSPPGTIFSRVVSAAAGTSTNREQSVGRALGESIERYSALAAPINGQVLPAGASAPYARAPRCATDEPCQPSFRGVPDETPLTHVEVRRLATDQLELLPAGFVHLGFQPRPGEPIVIEPISTGLAFRPELHEALWRGLCEVAERDATMLMWHCERGVPRITLDGGPLPDALADRLARLRRVGCTPVLFDTTTDFAVPTVFCMVFSDRGPYASAGGACHESPEFACAKALDEAVSVRSVLLTRFDAPSLVVFDWVTQLEQHALLYADRRARPLLRFLFAESRPVVAFDDFARRQTEPPRSLAEVRLCEQAWRARTDGALDQLDD